MRFLVKGMTCGHCAGAVRRAVEGAAPGSDVALDLKSGSVEVKGDAIAESIAAAIRAAGYEVQTAA